MAPRGTLTRAGCIGILACTKVVRTYCLFVVADAVAQGQLPLLCYLALALVPTAVAFLALQRPFGDRGHRLSQRSQVVHIGVQSIVMLGTYGLWALGLRYCGAVSTALLDASEIALLGGITWWVQPRFARDLGAYGITALPLMLGGFGLTLLDSSLTTDPARWAESSPLSTRLVGMLAQVLAALLTILHRKQARRAAVECGGAKRLHALAVLGAALASLPPAVFEWLRMEDYQTARGAWRAAWAACPATAVMLVVDFYGEAVARGRLESTSVCRVSLVATCVTALVLSVSRQPFALPALFRLVTVLCVVVGGLILLSSRGSVLLGLPGGKDVPDMRQGTSLLPLLIPAQAADGGWAAGTLSQLWARRTSRRLLILLAMNTTFMLVEVVIGVGSGSLALISDACHMLLDCASLVIGLCGEHISRWQPTSTHTFGYGRYEVLCGMANALLLLITSFELARESLFCLCLRAHEVKDESLIVVAAVGLAVNLLGLVLFAEHHQCISCAIGPHTPGSANMAGVFLHILADALGSVGVLTSSVLIRLFGWTFMDPICSFAISGLIAWSAWPLLVHSVTILMQRTPYMLDNGKMKDCLERLAKIDGVETIQDAVFWMLSSTENVATVRLAVSPSQPPAEVVKTATTLLKARGVHMATVEVNTVATTSIPAGGSVGLETLEASALEQAPPGPAAFA